MFGRVGAGLGRAAVAAARVAVPVAVAAGFAVHASGAAATAGGHYELYSKLDRSWDDTEMAHKAKYDEALAALAKDPEDGQLKWRAARATYGYTDDTTLPVDRKKALLADALRLVRDAKATERSDFLVFRWAGIILSKQQPYISTKEYIQNAFVVRDEWEQAIAIEPNDSRTLHFLGRWHYDVASMSWVVRKVAATLFAEPPTATYEEALEYFNRAEAISPGDYTMNRTMLAETHLRLNHKDDAKKWALAALELPVRGAYDKEAHDQAFVLLKRLDAAAAAEWQKQADAKRAAKEEAVAKAAKMA